MDSEKIVISATINGLRNQRDAYANEAVSLAAQNALLKEQLKEKQGEIDSLKVKKAKKPKEPAPL